MAHENGGHAIDELNPNANACLLDGITFDETCECCPESLSMSRSAGFTPYYVRPTWEDYKKLYNIK